MSAAPSGKNVKRAASSRRPRSRSRSAAPKRNPTVFECALLNIAQRTRFPLPVPEPNSGGVGGQALLVRMVPENLDDIPAPYRGLPVIAVQPGAATISRQHAILTACPNGDVWVEDLKSTNGTWLSSTPQDRYGGLKLEPHKHYIVPREGILTCGDVSLMVERSMQGQLLAGDTASKLQASSAITDTMEKPRSLPVVEAVPPPPAGNADEHGHVVDVDEPAPAVQQLVSDSFLEGLQGSDVHAAPEKVPQPAGDHGAEVKAAPLQYPSPSMLQQHNNNMADAQRLSDFVSPIDNQFHKHNSEPGNGIGASLIESLKKSGNRGDPTPVQLRPAASQEVLAVPAKEDEQQAPPSERGVSESKQRPSKLSNRSSRAYLDSTSDSDETGDESELKRPEAVSQEKPQAAVIPAPPVASAAPVESSAVNGSVLVPEPPLDPVTPLPPTKKKGNGQTGSKRKGGPDVSLNEDVVDVDAESPPHQQPDPPALPAKKKRTDSAAPVRLSSRLSAVANPAPARQNSRLKEAQTPSKGSSIRAVVTGMTSIEKDRTAAGIAGLGGRLLDEWDERCNVLVVPTTPCTRTPKVLMAIGRGVYVVTMKFIADGAPFDNVAAYVPAVHQTKGRPVNPKRILHAIEQHRDHHALEGRTFNISDVRPSSKQGASEIIVACGGSISRGSTRNGRQSGTIQSAVGHSDGGGIERLNDQRAQALWDAVVLASTANVSMIWE